MLRVIVTGCDDPGAADKVTTHVFLRRPDGCIGYIDARGACLSGRTSYANRSHLQWIFGIVVSVGCKCADLATLTMTPAADL